MLTLYADKLLVQGCTAEEYVIAAARGEIACIMTLNEFPMPFGLFYGPEQYQPTPESKLSALNNYLKVATHILPKAESLRASTMWHPDLDLDNIFVNPDNPTELVGITDWECIHLSPLFLQAKHPTLLHFEGPKPEGFSPSQLPENFNDMSPDEQKEAKELRTAQNLYKLYEVQSGIQNANILRALQDRETLQFYLTAMAGSLFADGEPFVNKLLMLTETQWLNVVGPGPDGRPSMPCPLTFSAQDNALQDEQLADWFRGFELMEWVLEEIGASVGMAGWDGWIPHDRYELMKSNLEKCFASFLDQEVGDDDSRRKAWIKAWPFVDHPSETSLRRYTPPRDFVG
jgi:hypothetical protein